MSIQFALCDAIDAIEARPLPRAERDRLQAPLLAQLAAVRAEQNKRAVEQRELAAEMLRMREAK